MPEKTRDLTFSVVINTTDRANSLRALLRALEGMAPACFEVIVVVGPTRDNTLDMLAEYAGRVRVLRCPQANLGLSRNIGLLAARGDIVAFVDDDAVPCQRWLAQLAVLFADPELAGTGGAVQLAHPSDPRLQHRLGLMSSLAEQHDVRATRVDGLPPAGRGIAWITRMMGTNMAYRRQRLLDAGGFDAFYEWVFDESDLNMRMRRAGMKVEPVAQALVYHFPASSRNRVAFTYTGKWWIQTKAGVYFAIKNGREWGDDTRALALRSLRLLHGHWQWSRHLLSERKITLRQFWSMRAHEVLGAALGARAGLGAPRAVASPAEVQAARATAPIVPFQDGQSPLRPAADPITGGRVEIRVPEPPLRIALLSSAYPPAEYEGVGRHTNLMARGLFECGHSVHVIARGQREQVSFYDGAYVHRLPVKLERFERFRGQPNLHWALNHSHGVHEKLRLLALNDGVQLADSPLWQLDGLVTSVSGEMPVVVRLQTAMRQVTEIQHTLSTDARLMGEMEEQLASRATHLVPNSRATLDAASKVYHLQPQPGRHTVIPHGIVPVPDTDTRPVDAASADAPRTVLYVGRLEKRKGILDLFDAIPRVLASAPQARFVIAGADNSLSDGFFERVGLTYPAFFAREHPGCAARTTFMGAVSEGVLQTLYQSCDLFVAPSLYESFGLIYTEAMNYAKPVIGCNAGGIPEVVEDGITGLLAEPGTPASLAAAITTLLQSPGRMREMGLAGRQRLLDKFTHVRMAQRFAEVYRRVIAEAQNPA